MTKASLYLFSIESNTAGSRNHRLTAVRLGLLCVLLLTAITLPWFMFTAERDDLQTSYTNLTTDRDQLLTSYTNLIIERDQLQTKNINLIRETDQLQKERDGLERRFSELGK